MAYNSPEIYAAVAGEDLVASASPITPGIRPFPHQLFCKIDVHLASDHQATYRIHVAEEESTPRQGELCRSCPHRSGTPHVQCAHGQDAPHRFGRLTTLRVISPPGQRGEPYGAPVFSPSHFRAIPGRLGIMGSTCQLDSCSMIATTAQTLRCSAGIDRAAKLVGDILGPSAAVLKVRWQHLICHVQDPDHLTPTGTTCQDR